MGNSLYLFSIPIVTGIFPLQRRGVHPSPSFQGAFLGIRVRVTYDWLGGLDSNQDSQIQSLESYQLDDLPAVGGTKRNRSPFPRIGTATIHPV
jgi:hypothetical protein